MPRNVNNPYLCVRFKENSGLGGWNKISAGYADTANSATWAYNSTDFHTNSIYIPQNTIDKWRIWLLDGSASLGGSSAADDLMFQYGAWDDWGEQWLRHDDKTNDDLDFTGSHRCIAETVY
eukprot:765414-Hanusia_phi.AAC.1